MKVTKNFINEAETELGRKINDVRAHNPASPDSFKLLLEQQ